MEDLGPETEVDQPVKSKWMETDTSALTEENKRLLLSVVVMIATRLIFHHHCYSFNGVVFRQKRGGPIGLRFTSIVARLVMDQWIQDFITSIIKAGMEVHGLMKYVDDINMVLAWVELGTRWVGGSLVHRSEWEMEDIRAGKSNCAVTMEAMRTAADEVIPWLDFTVDYPELHEDKTVPMLDLQVWVRHPDPADLEGHDALGWCFFEKATSSEKVLCASSAYNWRNKIVTMNMEVWRRLRNCTRQLDPVYLAKILCRFVTKLRESGYVEATVTGILKSGVKFYSRKLRTELDGGPPINQNSEVESLKRRRLKLGATEKWFSRRRGGHKETQKKDNGWRADQQQTESGGGLGPPCGRLAEGGGSLGGEVVGDHEDSVALITLPEVANQPTEMDPRGQLSKSRSKSWSGGGPAPPHGMCAEGGGHTRKDPCKIPLKFASTDIRYRGRPMDPGGPEDQDPAMVRVGAEVSALTPPPAPVVRSGSGPRSRTDGQDRDENRTFTGAGSAVKGNARTQGPCRTPEQTTGHSVKPSTKEKIGRLPGTKRLGQDSKMRQKKSLLTWMSRSLGQGLRPTAAGVSCEPEVPEKAEEEVACEPGPGPMGPRQPRRHPRGDKRKEQIEKTKEVDSECETVVRGQHSVRMKWKPMEPS